MILDRGAKLGPYEILEPLGAGGMGEVYKARDTRLNRLVAIKISGAQFSERFEREARAIAALNHPHICALYDVGPDYLVMELVGGPTLAGRIAAGRILPPEALAIARQIADALEAAHEKGIVHRDLKPANVKITPEGVVKVLDFGLAKSDVESAAAADSTNSPTLTISPTRAGTILGTAAYMSPEQVRGAAVDRRSDIWAFGVVLYEMLAGNRLFAGESVSDILAGVLRAEPDWSALPTDTPPRICKLLRRCLERDRKQRLQAIGEARITIDAPEEMVAAPVASRSSRAPFAVAALALACALLTTIAWWRATRPIAHPLVRISAELTAVPDTIPSFRLDADTIFTLGQPGAFLALSPDGTRLAVSVRGADGKTRLATRRLDESRFVILSGTDDRPSSPFFSPDSQWIGFFAEGKLKKVPVQGGAPVALCDAGAFATGSWGVDGTIIVALGQRGGLSRIPDGGGRPEPVTDLQKGETVHRWPQILPGGKAVLFTAYTSSSEEGNIEVFSFKTRERKTIVPGSVFARYLPSGHLVYVHENRLLAVRFNLSNLSTTGLAQPVLDDVTALSPSNLVDFDFSRNGTIVYISGQRIFPRSIFWIDHAGDTQPLHPSPGFYSTPSFSPDGKRLAFSLGDAAARQDIWLQDLDRDNAVRLTSGTGTNRSPVWTHDSKYILFASHNQPNAGIYSIRADGSGEAQLLRKATAVNDMPASISPDGKWLIMEAGNPFAVRNISIAPIEKVEEGIRLGKTEPLFTASGFVLPVFSPDGHWLAYASGETGIQEVYVRPFPAPGRKRLISTAGGSFPIWSRSGREIFFLGLDRRIMVADYAVDGDTFVPGIPRVACEKQILLNNSGGPFRPYAPAPDGKRFVVVLYPDGTAQEHRTIHLTFLFNFFDELRRRVPAEGI